MLKNICIFRTFTIWTKEWKNSQETFGVVLNFKVQMRLYIGSVHVACYIYIIMLHSTHYTHMYTQKLGISKTVDLLRILLSCDSVSWKESFKMLWLRICISHDCEKSYLLQKFAKCNENS